jgi:gas vesicle protein
VNDITPDKIKDLLESAINSSTSAWVAQSRYFDDLVKRNVSSFASLADSRVDSLKQISESTTFNDAFEANVAYEDAVRDELKKMYDDNASAWEKLQGELKEIYTPASSEKAVSKKVVSKKAA